MWRHLASNAITVMIVGLFLLVGVVAWGTGQYSSPGPLSQAICLQVPSGSNMRSVAERLVEDEAISSPMIFRMGADYSDKSRLLKAGSFRVPEEASMEEIVDIVTRGGRNTCGTEVIYRIGINRTLVDVRELDPASNEYVQIASFNPAEVDAPEDYLEIRESSDTTFRVAVAEGATSWQVAYSLGELDILQADVTDTPAEGSLAPGSYDIQPGQSVAAILRSMHEIQETTLADLWEMRADELPIQTPEEALILASIVEKETSVPEERKQVASVFVNRLNQGMRLQTDPTVIYGITQGEGVLGRGLRQSELRAATPWNTYVIEGLPPTPIANPGRASIEAALNPDNTEYIFFVADGTGGHAFATNLDDHNRNVARWREIEAERANANDG